MERTLGVEPKDIIQNEVDLFAKLEFGLFIDPKEVMPHLNRIKTILEINQPELP
jgi:hypothetical protein